MQRFRPLIAMSSIAVALMLAPVLAAVARGADPVVVRSGDTLTSISERSGIPVERLVELNDIHDPNRIFIGQRLIISDAAPAAAPSRDPDVVHTVRGGDSLWGIARHYGTTVAAIAAANGVADPSRIFGGQRLTIPGAATSPAPVRAAAPPRMPASMAGAVADRDSIRRIIVEEAARFGVPAPFALAVAWQESGWRQGVVSYAGAIGVMQLLPSTAEWVGDTMLESRVDVHDTRGNVRAGVRLLAHYLDRYAGNVDLVLAAYYQGQTAADRHGVYAMSRPYIASIAALTRIFGG